MPRHDQRDVTAPKRRRALTVDHARRTAALVARRMTAIVERSAARATHRPVEAAGEICGEIPVAVSSRPARDRASALPDPAGDNATTGVDRRRARHR